jgi:hypothetical protein
MIQHTALDYQEYLKHLQFQEMFPGLANNAIPLQGTLYAAK